MRRDSRRTGSRVGETIVINFVQSLRCSARTESCTAASGESAPSVATSRSPAPKSAAGSWFHSRTYSSVVYAALTYQLPPCRTTTTNVGSRCVPASCERSACELLSSVLRSAFCISGENFALCVLAENVPPSTVTFA